GGQREAGPRRDIPTALPPSPTHSPSPIPSRPYPYTPHPPHTQKNLTDQLFSSNRRSGAATRAVRAGAGAGLGVGNSGQMEAGHAKQRPKWLRPCLQGARAAAGTAECQLPYPEDRGKPAPTILQHPPSSPHRENLTDLIFSPIDAAVLSAETNATATRLLRAPGCIQRGLGPSSAPEPTALPRPCSSSPPPPSPQRFTPSPGDGASRPPTPPPAAAAAAARFPPQWKRHFPPLAGGDGASPPPPAAAALPLPRRLRFSPPWKRPFPPLAGGDGASPTPRPPPLRPRRRLTPLAGGNGAPPRPPPAMALPPTRVPLPFPS
ncbi:unnamed protein product, partial [Bubo scandiacus]